MFLQVIFFCSYKKVFFLFLQANVKSPTFWSLFNFNIFTGNAPGEEVSIFLKWIIVTFSLINDHLCIYSFEWWYVTKQFSVEVLSINFNCSSLYIRFSRLFYQIPDTQTKAQDLFGQLTKIPLMIRCLLFSFQKQTWTFKLNSTCKCRFFQQECEKVKIVANEIANPHICQTDFISSQRWDRLSLTDLLAKPHQRIPRYRLLIQVHVYLL